MNKTPSILVNTGFPVDQNGILTELDIPSVVSTLSVPQKITFLGEILNWIPSTSAVLQEINAPNCNTITFKQFSGYTQLQTATIGKITTLGSSNATGGDFAGCANLVTVNLNEVTSMASYGSNTTYGGAFYGDTSLKYVNMSSLSSISDTAGVASNTINVGGSFCNCTGLENITLPSLTTIYLAKPTGGGEYRAGAFYNCTSLRTVTFEKLVSITESNSGGGSITGGTFGNCTSLETVTFGSEGHAVTGIASNTFRNCTQSGLTITVYTQGGAALSGSPWGATNATIVYEEA